MPMPGPGFGPGLSGFVGGGKTPKTHALITQKAYEAAGGRGSYKDVFEDEPTTQRLGVEEERVIPYIPGSTMFLGPLAGALGGGAAQGAAAAGATVPEAALLGAAGAGTGYALERLFGEGGDENAIGEPWWFEGPGLYEPPAEVLVKEWKRRIDSKDGDYNLQYYLVKRPGRQYEIYMYSQRTRMWKHWYMPKPAVIGKNMPSHKMLTRLRRNLKRHKDDAKTILKLTDPTFMAKAQGTYRRRSRRR